jgi:hypothetical protein
MKRIGLLGGMSWESSAEHYRFVNQAVRDRLGGLHSADCLLRSVDFAVVEDLQRTGRWDEAGKLLVAEAQALEQHRHGGGWSIRCWPRCGTTRRGCGGSPTSSSPWPAAAPATGSPPPLWGGRGGVDRSSGAEPGRDAIAAAWPAGRTGRARPSMAASAKAQPARAVGPVEPGVGLPVGGVPRPGAATPAAPRSWSLSAASAASAIPAPCRRSDRAVVAPSADHLRQRLLGETAARSRRATFWHPQAQTPR